MIFKTDKSQRTFTGFPGCESSLCVSHDMAMHPDFQGRGHAHEEQAKSLQKMKLMGYDYAICTVDSSNLAQVTVLQRARWRHLDSFHNTCTGHTVFMFGKRLEEVT